MNVKPLSARADVRGNTFSNSSFRTNPISNLLGQHPHVEKAASRDKRLVERVNGLPSPCSSRNPCTSGPRIRVCENNDQQGVEERSVQPHDVQAGATVGATDSATVRAPAGVLQRRGGGGDSHSISRQVCRHNTHLCFGWKAVTCAARVKVCINCIGIAHVILQKQCNMPSFVSTPD